MKVLGAETGKRWPFVACILVQSVVYGLGNPLTKVGFESISALWCLAVRFTLATILLLAVGGRQSLRQLKAAGLKNWLPASACIAAAYITCNLALSLTTATNVGFLMSLPVLFTPLLSLVFLRSRYPLGLLPVQGVVILGLYLLCCGEGGFRFGLGEVLALVCALCLAGTLILSQRSLSDLRPVTMAAAQTGVAALVSMVAALVFDDVSALGRVTPQAWGVVAYLAVVCSCLAYVLQNLALTRLSACTVSMLQCTQPILTAVFSFLLLGERLTLPGLLGAGLIVLGVFYENWSSLRRERAAAP